MNHQAIANEINRDINRGVYTQFRWLGKRLEIVAHNLVKCVYISNSDFPADDLKLLRENDYITKHEYENELGKEYNKSFQRRN